MKFIGILAYAKLSLIELYRLQRSDFLNFDILFHSQQFVILSCSSEVARKIGTRSGGIFKIGRMCGSSITELLDTIPLPDRPKFNWTVSAYHCDEEILEETKDRFGEHLKRSSLGKARFIKPDPVGHGVELKISTLVNSILTGNMQREPGLDVIVACGSNERFYGFTKYASDVERFKERDFGRPYKDPTLTMSPRLAKTLVNLCCIARGRTVLDPFCGLGTVLQEALLLGYNVLGVEVSSAEVKRCRENLNWFANRFQISPKLNYKIIQGDAMELDSLKLPRVDAIATEPILIPKLTANETAAKSEEILKQSGEKYAEAFRAFSEILNHGGVVSIVVPDLIDDRGKSHRMDLINLVREYGFVPVRLNFPGFENPCVVPTTKKKIIRRNIYLMQHG